MKSVIMIRIALVIVIVGSCIMLYINFNSDLPEYFYLWKNPDFKVNTLITFTIIYVFGIIANSFLLYFSFIEPDEF